MKTFSTLEEMIDWKAGEMHEANLVRGGVFYEGRKEDFNEAGSELRAVPGVKNVFRVSNLSSEREWVAKSKVRHCPIVKSVVIDGDNAPIAIVG